MADDDHALGLAVRKPPLAEDLHALLVRDELGLVDHGGGRGFGRQNEWERAICDRTGVLNWQHKTTGLTIER